MILTDELFAKYRPQRKWFIHDSDGIHGMAHEMRVLVLSEIIGECLRQNGEQVDQESLRWAAITHDTQRYDDGSDGAHGRRAAAWVREALIGDYSIDDVSYLNQWHVPDDSFAPKMTMELKVLKDADGLDRWRVGVPDMKYIRTAPALEMFDLSRQFYEASLRLGQNHDPVSSVIEAARQLGLYDMDDTSLVLRPVPKVE